MTRHHPTLIGFDGYRIISRRPAPAHTTLSERTPGGVRPPQRPRETRLVKSTPVTPRTPVSTGPAHHPRTAATTEGQR